MTHNRITDTNKSACDNPYEVSSRFRWKILKFEEMCNIDLFIFAFIHFWIDLTS